MIEPLPEGHNLTCDKVRSGGGWSRDAANPDRCGLPAVVLDRQACGCGACDLSCHLCEGHARRSGTEEERREDEKNWLDWMTEQVRGWPEGRRRREILECIETWKRDGAPRFQIPSH